MEITYNSKWAIYFILMSRSHRYICQITIVPFFIRLKYSFGNLKDQVISIFCRSLFTKCAECSLQFIFLKRNLYISNSIVKILKIISQIQAIYY